MTDVLALTQIPVIDHIMDTHHRESDGVTEFNEMLCQLAGDHSVESLSLRAIADEYRNLPASATALLHAAILINSTVTSALAVALGIDDADVTDRLAVLVAGGWLEADPGGDVRWVQTAHIWLTYDASDHIDSSVLHADDTVVAARYLDHHSTALAHLNREEAAEWIARHRATLLAAINAGVRTGLTERVITVARTAWTFADSPEDQAWHHSLAAAAEPAARDNRGLLDLIRHSAHHTQRAGDLETAEDQYCRAVGLAFQLTDHDAAISTLTALVRVLRDSEQPSSAADALLELADLHQHVGDTLARATALAELGEIMLTGGRPRLADIYFTRVIELLDQKPDSPSVALAHAYEFRGLALWALGNTNLARKAFREAMAYVDSGDTSTRERMETLIRRKRPRNSASASATR